MASEWARSCCRAASLYSASCCRDESPPRPNKAATLCGVDPSVLLPLPSAPASSAPAAWVGAGATSAAAGGAADRATEARVVGGRSAKERETEKGNAHK